MITFFIVVTCFYAGIGLAFLWFKRTRKGKEP